MFFTNILNFFVGIFTKIKEKREEEIENILISKIFFIRHGKSHYKEYTCGEKKIDLCPEGIRQVEKTANLLLEKIDNKLPVFLVSSPRIRTLNTAKIIKDFLTFWGIEITSEQIFEDKSFEAIRLNKENLSGASYRLGMNYLSWISDSYNDILIEPYDSFFERIKKVFKEEIDSIRRNRRKNKQVVIVSHGEVFDAFMLGFCIWKEYDHKNMLENGEIVEIQVFPKKVIVLYRKEKYILDSKLNPLL